MAELIRSDPKRAYQLISLLPSEMIAYELETQGINAHKKLNQRRSQLSACILSELYVPFKQPVVMSLKDDFEICREYFNLWKENFDPEMKSRVVYGKMYFRLKFLEPRILRLDSSTEDEALN